MCLSQRLRCAQSIQRSERIRPQAYRAALLALRLFALQSQCSYAHLVQRRSHGEPRNSSAHDDDVLLSRPALHSACSQAYAIQSQTGLRSKSSCKDHTPKTTHHLWLQHGNSEELFCSSHSNWAWLQPAAPDRLASPAYG